MATKSSNYPNGWPALVLFGDSITEGIWRQEPPAGYSFGAALTDLFSRRIQVLERGFSGYNTSNAVVIVDDVIPPTGGALDLKLLIVFFGANDAVIPPYFQHVHLEEYKTNLKAIVQHKHVGIHSAKVVIVAPPPVCEHKIYPSEERKSAVTRTYAEAAAEVAADTGAELLDLWGIFMEHAGWTEGEPLLGEIGVPKSEKLGELLSDGLHFTHLGYKLYFDSLKALLEKKLPEIYDCPRGFPNWGEAPRCQ